MCAQIVCLCDSVCACVNQTFVSSGAWLWRMDTSEHLMYLVCILHTAHCMFTIVLVPKRKISMGMSLLQQIQPHVRNAASPHKISSNGVLTPIRGHLMLFMIGLWPQRLCFEKDARMTSLAKNACLTKAVDYNDPRRKRSAPWIPSSVTLSKLPFNSATKLWLIDAKVWWEGGNSM